MQSEFRLPSSDGLHKLEGIRWIPEGETRGVLVLVHGMVEHITRYEEFGRHLAAHGIAVLGYDQLGHGKTADNNAELGYFAEEDGDRLMVQDIYRMTQLAKKLWPGKPVFVLGHSMGSFLLRRFLCVYGDTIDGAIICGTGNITPLQAAFGAAVAKILALVKGPFYRSKLMDALAIDQYARQYGRKSGKRSGSWLSKNQESVAAYDADPLCGFSFTVGAYRDFFHLLGDLAREKNFDKIPRELPLLLTSGMDDPLGQYQRGVLAVYNRFTEMGMKDTDLFFYPEDRHEILQETDRLDVFSDIEGWILKRCGD